MTEEFTLILMPNCPDTTDLDAFKVIELFVSEAELVKSTQLKIHNEITNHLRDLEEQIEKSETKLRTLSGNSA